MITVAIPTWNTPNPLLRRAVETVLANPHTHVVVVNDAGTPPWPHLTDLDITRVDLPVNRGAFWARQIVLTATRTEWFATVDSDDWIEPTIYRRLIDAAQGHDGAMCGRVTHNANGYNSTTTAPRRHNVGQWRHVASHCSAIWNTRFLRSIGGYHPDRRLGDDSRMVNGATAAGDIALIDDALYHYVRRAGSLTTTRATRPNSPARRQSGKERRQLQALMQQIPPDEWHTITATSHPVEFAADVQRVRDALKVNA